MPLKWETPLQALVASAFGYGLWWLVDVYTPNISIRQIPPAAIILLFIAWIYITKLVSGIGHYFDFILSEKSGMRGFFVEGYHQDNRLRISLYAITYSVFTRTFNVNGISFAHKLSDGALSFERHTKWNSTSFCHHEESATRWEISYRLEFNRLDPHQTGLSKIDFRSFTTLLLPKGYDSAQSEGSFTDIAIRGLNDPIYFQNFRLTRTGAMIRLRQRLCNTDAALLKRFISDEYAGAQLITQICTKILTQEQIVQPMLVSGMRWPATFVDWLRENVHKPPTEPEQSDLHS